ncbi:lipopolysaccharide biosynthesis protein [Nostoc sp. CENA543]|uniref:GumC family protein n=1 Tax=Nostoc sp. CENA543 TaxID=1869241 RepID=UPI000CA0D512|nr:polysaccharide biosynthesis tyrosine autokinase [Nostoc sp. CENA543]AUT00929.1 lipopolysaccharide biosynthesis protein [Nostoc sp. CENA543]
METQENYFSFDNYWHILKRRGLPATLVFIPVLLAALLAISYLRKPAYLAEAKIKLQRTNSTSTITSVGTQISKLEPLVQDNQTSPLNTEAEVIRSRPFVKITIKQLNLKNHQGHTLKIQDFLKNLKVEEVKGTDILRISYHDTNPETSVKVVNTLLEIYLEHHVYSLRSQAAASRKFIEKQLPNAELVLLQAEARLANFKEKHKVTNLQEELTKALEVITDLQKQINASQSKIADTEAQSQKIRQQLGMNSQQALQMTSISQTLGVQNIFQEIQQLEANLAARRVVLQDTHPQIIELTEKLSSLKQLLQQRIYQATNTNNFPANQNIQLSQLQQILSAKLVELESIRLGAVNQVATLSNLQVNYKKRLNSLPNLEQQQRQLERKVQAAQVTYSLLLEKLQESRIAENQNIGNASIIALAEVNEEPINSPVISYLLAGLLACLASLATVYILELKDKYLKTIDEVRALFGLTLLAVIPAVNRLRKYAEDSERLEYSDQRIIIRDFPRSPISEAYRMLRENLRFISADKQLKVIVVTSSVSQEGKSTVAANLATAIAQKEHQVLLIDADLHHPMQHKIWDINNSQGLSNVIVDQVGTTTAIKAVMEHLDVLTAGVVPPNPAALLDSKRMATLIDKFAAKYNFVIIDTPALNLAADAATLGQMADGVLLVVRPGVVDSVNANFAKEFIEKSGQNVLGMVVNGVIPQNERYSYYFAEEDYPQESIKVPLTTIGRRLSR